MGLKSNDPFKSAVGPLDLDSPFIAISKYHVENRVFRNCSHSCLSRPFVALASRSGALVKRFCETNDERRRTRRGLR